MERYRALAEDGVIFLVMAVFSVIKQILMDEEVIDWRKLFAKLFVQVVAGVGFYSFLLSYKPWYGEYPQKVGIIMIVTYMGSRLIDLVVDKTFKWIRKVDLKVLIKKLLEL